MSNVVKNVRINQKKKERKQDQKFERNTVMCKALKEGIWGSAFFFLNRE